MTIQATFDIRRKGFVLDVNLNLPSRGVTSLFGPSGCGKTTLLRAIAGLDCHKGGFLRMNGMIWQEANIFVPPHQRSLGYVFQEASLFKHLNVQGNLDYGLKRVPATDYRIELSDIIELMGIGHLLDCRPETLSGGERQRVAIARALAASPGLLLMDEPLSALDRNGRQELLPYLDSLFRELNIPVIYVSHVLEETSRLADYLVLLKAVNVEAEGDIHPMLTRLGFTYKNDNSVSSLIEGTVFSHDDRFHFTLVEAGANRIALPKINQPVGRKITLKVVAKDVSLYLEYPSGSSLQNLFPVTVKEIIQDNGAMVTVMVEAGSMTIYSRITDKAAHDLVLVPGKNLVAGINRVYSAESVF